MMLKLRRIAVVLTAALTLAAASIPTNAEAFGFLLAPALLVLRSLVRVAGVGRAADRGAVVAVGAVAVGTTPAGSAAAVKSGLRLRRRRAVATAVGAAAAAVGMAAVTTVGNFWIKSWLL
jgi:hypothetical protein